MDTAPPSREVVIAQMLVWGAGKRGVHCTVAVPAVVSTRPADGVACGLARRHCTCAHIEALVAILNGRCLAREEYAV
jgi:hypothetical protein